MAFDKAQERRLVPNTVRFHVLLLVVLVGAGCVGREDVESFDGPDLPPGWSEHSGSWRIVNASSAGRVLSGLGDADPGLSSLVNDGFGRVKGFEITVSVGLISGSDPQGAGIVFDWVDDRNYNIVRYSTHEHGWHLFTVIEGERTKDENATTSTQTDPGFNVWVELRVVQDGRRVTAFDGTTLVIDARLPDAASSVGLVGVFVRGNSRAYFDDFRVRTD